MDNTCDNAMARPPGDTDYNNITSDLLRRYQ